MRKSKLALPLAILLAGSMWFYVRRVLVPYQRVDAAIHSRPRGNLSDLYPRWLGTRELLLHHRDPYTADVTREIQTGYYGRPLDPTREGEPKDEERFAYPVYVAFLLAPTVGFDFSVVQAGFRCLLLILTAVSVPIWLRAIRCRTNFICVVILIILTLGCFPVAQGLELQQLSLLVSALIAGCLALLGSGYFGLAGVVLAAATIKPQLALPLVAWLCLWALSDWRKRKRFIYGLGLTTALLVIGGEFILPGWVRRFVEAIVAYRQYTNSKSILYVLTTNRVGGLFTVAVVALVGFHCWRDRRESSDAVSFVLASSLVLAATVVIVPSIAPYNQVLLLPGIFLLTRNLGVLPGNAVTKILAGAARVAIFWPWVATLGLVVSSSILPAKRLQQAWALPLYTSIAIPVAVLMLLFQYAFQISSSGNTKNEEL